MVKVGSVWLPKIQHAFFQAERTGDQWSLWNASGVRFEYDALSRTGTRSWNLSGIVDRYGNRVALEWATSPVSGCGTAGGSDCVGQRLLDTVRYFTNDNVSAVQARVELRFVWGSRSSAMDAMSSARQGELVYLEKRLARIEVWVDHGTRHAYNILFTYVPDKFDPNSELLGAIEARTPDGVTRRVLRRFGYAPAITALAPAEFLQQIEGQVPLPVQADSNHGDQGVRVLDVNGDGFADLAYNMGTVFFGSPTRPGRFTQPLSDPYNTFFNTIYTPMRCFVRTRPGTAHRESCGWSPMTSTATPAPISSTSPRSRRAPRPTRSHSSTSTTGPPGSRRARR